MKKIMMTGITGYVGHLLLDRLLNLGFEVKALVRNPAKIDRNHPHLTLITGDIRDEARVREAMRGCEVAFYLVHGLDESGNFEYEEALSAKVFTQASNLEGIQKIIYLGGLGESKDLSPHLRSRQLTGQILALGRAKVLEFRASVVLGRGSTSYEIIAALVNRLPVFVEAANLKAHCQPIHQDDLLAYLISGVNLQLDESKIIGIGGGDQLSYAELLIKVAAHAGIRRKVIPLPWLDERLMFEAFELICPEYARVGGHLVESLSHPTVVTNDLAQTTFPEIRPRSLQQALDEIGRVKPEARSVVSIEHSLKIMKMLEGRFDVLQKLKPLILQAMSKN
jgi:uncharacterized protein YbjT (DUF2867 family)